MKIIEPSRGERSEIRHTRIEVTLLGAYHDGMIRLTYPKVYRYKPEFEEFSGIEALVGAGRFRD